MTAWPALIVNVQLPVPEQSPDQPVKRLPLLGVALSTMAAPSSNCAVQADPHVIPAGLLTTVPVPLQRLDTVRVRRDGDGPNVAVTEWAAFIVRVHAPVPVQSPDHPVKLSPDAGVAVRVTSVPPAKLAEQVEPQSIPAGLLVTVPLPLPAFETVSVGDPEAVNVAVTV